MNNNTKILVVDDEINIITSISFLLKQEGYIVETANNGAEALEKYKIFLPEIILLDVMMPVMDGITTAKEIRKLDTNSDSTIIFLTAKGTSLDKQTGYISGGDDYVVKPFENEALLDLISEKVR